MARMDVYHGSLRETVVPTDVVDLGCGAGEAACAECAGTGTWDFAEPEVPAGPCVTCKGAGRVLVSV